MIRTVASKRKHKGGFRALAHDILCSKVLLKVSVWYVQRKQSGVSIEVDVLPRLAYQNTRGDVSQTSAADISRQSNRRH